MEKFEITNASLAKLTVSIIIATIPAAAIISYNATETLPEVWYKLEPSQSINLSDNVGDNRIGEIGAAAKNIGDKSVNVTFGLRGENVEFVIGENSPILWTENEWVFYKIPLEKNMDNYVKIPQDSNFQFYIGENVTSFSITIEIANYNAITSIINKCYFNPVYPTTVEYVQTAPNAYSLV